jgi:hypothetical protein
MSSHGLENLPVHVTVLIHIPEGRHATNLSTKKQVQKSTQLATGNSEIRTLHCEATERIPMDLE